MYNSSVDLNLNTTMVSDAFLADLMANFDTMRDGSGTNGRNVDGALFYPERVASHTKKSSNQISGTPTGWSQKGPLKPPPTYLGLKVDNLHRDADDYGPTRLVNQFHHAI